MDPKEEKKVVIDGEKIFLEEAIPEQVFEPNIHKLSHPKDLLQYYKSQVERTAGGKIAHFEVFNKNDPSSALKYSEIVLRNSCSRKIGADPSQCSIDSLDSKVVEKLKNRLQIEFRQGRTLGIASRGLKPEDCAVLILSPQDYNSRVTNVLKTSNDLETFLNSILYHEGRHCDPSNIPIKLLDKSTLQVLKNSGISMRFIEEADSTAVSNFIRLKDAIVSGDDLSSVFSIHSEIYTIDWKSHLNELSGRMTFQDKEDAIDTDYFLLSKMINVLTNSLVMDILGKTTELTEVSLDQLVGGTRKFKDISDKEIVGLASKFGRDVLMDNLDDYLAASEMIQEKRNILSKSQEKRIMQLK